MNQIDPAHFDDVPARLQRALDVATPLLKQRAAQVDEAASYPYEQIRTLHEAGLLAAGLSSARGGADFGRTTSFAHYFDTVTAIARACSNTAQLFTVQTGALFSLELLGKTALVDEVAQAVR
ncbi:acyl-CoA dehydrogenase family protein [Caballeronia sp. LZ065]|uniref:acyl-CoA dehydrogenase family protein n=1 Tax=Caballeronia sp. LZ065 TaxID=3038571 RepID=UPI0028581733|nr:acyl-CoA dehydrogenase family protein [Caballeronia sp. LZ065]MDR5781605.1 acyl-CoA dehydrogenase family protein [Caballeronia sp. LZ065]